MAPSQSTIQIHLNWCAPYTHGHGQGCPVRGAAFDPLRAQFATSGDDFKVNYTSGEVVHTFSHPNYVRSLEYHPRRPWLLGASDDLTASIVDVERRERLCQLTGHEHFVMSARFHPHEPLVVTASMDRSARVWLLKETLGEGGGETRLSFTRGCRVFGCGRHAVVQWHAHSAPRRSSIPHQ
jgi:coatomer protein complex subunit alpha (xenin)